MPLKKAKDYNFIISFVLLVAIAGYIALEEVRRMSLVSYLKTLQHTVAESIYEDEEREKFNDMFDDFLARASYEELDQEEIDSLSKKILSLRVNKDSLDLEKAKQFIPEPVRPKGENSIALSQIIPRVPEGDWKKEQDIFLKKCREYDSLIIHVKPPLPDVENKILEYEKSYKKSWQQVQEVVWAVEMYQDAIIAAKPDDKEALKDIEKNLQTELKKLENQKTRLRLEIKEISTLNEGIENQKNALLNEQNG